MSARYYVYTLLDGAGVPVYVGRSSNVASRLQSHHNEAQALVRNGDDSKATWFYRTRDLKMSGPYTYDVGSRIERGRIEALQPIGNKQYTARHYHQGGGKRR